MKKSLLCVLLCVGITVAYGSQAPAPGAAQDPSMMDKIESTFKRIDQRVTESVKNCRAGIVNKYHEIEQAYKKVGQKLAGISKSQDNTITSTQAPR